MCRPALLILLLLVTSASGQEKTANPARLTLDRIFASDEFRGEPLAPVKWLDHGAYTTLQPSKAHKSAQRYCPFRRDRQK